MSATYHPPLRVYDPPEGAWADWPDDRVSCADCRNRSGFMCAALRVSHVPTDVLHRCERFVRRVEFKRRAAA